MSYQNSDLLFEFSAHRNALVKESHNLQYEEYGRVWSSQVADIDVRDDGFESQPMQILEIA